MLEKLNIHSFLFFWHKNSNRKCFGKIEIFSYFALKSFPCFYAFALLFLYALCFAVFGAYGGV